MNNAKLTILALLLASLAATPALAQRHGWSATGDQDRRPGQRIEALTEQLDLTPEQAAEIQAVIAERDAERRAWRDTSRATREEIRLLMATEPFNESRLRELVDKQAQQRAERMVSSHTTRAAIDRVLTPEQQEKHHAMQQRLEHQNRQRGMERRGECRRL